MRGWALFGVLVAGIGGSSIAVASADTPVADPAAWLAMPGIDVPIIDGGRIDGMLSLDLTLVATDAGHAAALADRIPALREAALAAAADYARLHVSGRTPVDARGLADAVTAGTRRVSDGVTGVLLTRVRATPA